MLFMSGWVTGFDLAGYPLLAKPFKPQQLVSKIREVLASGLGGDHVRL